MPVASKSASHRPTGETWRTTGAADAAEGVRQLERRRSSRGGRSSAGADRADREPEPTLAWDDVHVWAASIDAPWTNSSPYLSILSADEQDRADSFVFERDRRRFVTARGILRTLLGDYAGHDPSSLMFEYNAFGKPFLPNGDDLTFNLSHAGGLALFVFARKRRVGIDVERVRNDLATDGIAQRYFSDREASDLEAIELAERPAAFFSCWTVKEAYIKARGEGLHIPLDSFEVRVDRNRRLGSAELDVGVGAPALWTTKTWAPARNHVAAVVVENTTNGSPNFEYMNFGLLR